MGFYEISILRDLTLLLSSLNPLGLFNFHIIKFIALNYVIKKSCLSNICMREGYATGNKGKELFLDFDKAHLRKG